MEAGEPCEVGAEDSAVPAADNASGPHAAPFEGSPSGTRGEGNGSSGAGKKQKRRC